ncbi:MAG: hypothetical protein Q9195_004599 [Heterodermia aff. obscurata]
MAATATIVTPAVARMLDPLRTPTLETMMIAGESLSPAVMAKWTEHVPVFNLYGPCECTALCTAMKYEKGSRTDKILIGRGVGCSTWVVNSEMDELVPIGTVGELIIQGPNVGCGYLNQSANIADAFICNPSWLSSRHDGGEYEQSRGYVTGDLVRYDDNGYLDFLGRKDTQRKIRGQRFDLSEVEDCAHAILGGGIEVVAEVCTAADAPGTNLLVGFVRVSDQNTALKQNLNISHKGLIMSADQGIREIGLKLKTSMSKVLPAYMIPTTVVKLSRTPWILPSMKIDRNALRLSIGEMSRAQISEYETGETSSSVMPATETQRLLQNIWAATLGMQAANIGLNANFFQLGGDSVSAIQLISTARTQGMHIKMANVLKNPKLSDMALALETLPAEDATESLVAPFSLLGGLDSKAIVHEVARCCNVREAQIEDVYPCTPLQEGMMALSMKKFGSLVACTVYELPKNIDFPRLRAAWTATARANSIMRTRIVHLGRVGMVQVVLANDPTFDAALTLEDCLSSHCNESLCLGSTLDYFACIGENTDRPKYVVRKMHHAICDGWQDNILLEQLTRAYQGEQLPKETMFNTFVRYVLNQNNEKASAFWREQLSGAPPVTFPVKRSATYTPWASDSRKHYVRLPSGLSDPHFTLSTSIRLAWALVLGEYTTSGDVVFGATLTGRNAPVTGIEKVTGPAIATVPLRVRLNYQDTVHCALDKIQEQAIAMLPYEQTGLQHIRKLGAKIAEICDFQTLIVIQPPETANDIAVLKKCDHQPDARFPFGSFGLVLECTISNDREKVAVKAQVDRSMLDPEQVDNILKQFDSVLSQICKYSSRRLAEIEVVSPEDVAKLRRWNAKMPSSVDRTLHDLFGERCHAHPMAPAVSTSLEGLNYSELDDLSSRLATHLRTIGIRQGVVVPLFVGNSCMSALAMLGVLKSGGTCACLDLGQPRQRLDHILHEVDAKIALVAGSKSSLLGNFDVEFIPLTRSWLETLPRVVDVEWPQDPTGAAFLVFTSGSTKAPKGIVLEHKALASGVSSFIAFCGLELGCRMLQFASSVFDVFIYEHLTALLAGGCLCIPSEHEKMNGIADFALKTKPNLAILTSTAVKSIDIIPSMRTLGLAGEPINLDAVSLWEPLARLVNVAAEVLHIKAQDDPCLIAFVSTSPTVEFGSRGLILPPEHRLLRAHVVLQELSKTLPAYMIPSALLPVRYLPKSASDKLDRKQLRQATAELTVEDLMAYSSHDLPKLEAPKTSEERLMSNLWAGVLGKSLETIGSNSNFFHLGGDSVGAMRLVSAARSKKRLLTVQNIFKVPVLSDLTREWAAVSQERENKQAWSPFSLLTSFFLAEHVSKQFQIDIDDVVDVLPATFHQAWEIQVVSPCYVFHFDDGVDLDRLLKSWDQVVEKHEILRTVIIPYGDKYLQIILNKLGYGIEFHSVEEMSPNFIERHSKTDPPAAGKSLLDIMVVKAGDQIALSLRISHVLYDGWCIGEYWKDWGTAFAGSKITEKVQLRNFLYTTAKADLNASYDYWRNLLAGSVPTLFRGTCNDDSVSTEERITQTTRTITLGSIPETCTMATFIKASWVMTLARRLLTLDIVMTQLSNGRRSGPENSEDVIGPCLGYFPVRVTIQKHWKALDIFQFIQNQDVESMSFENVQLHDLVAKCTDWPSDMRQYLGSILFHTGEEWVKSKCLEIQDREYPITVNHVGYMPRSVDLDTSVIGSQLEIGFLTSSRFLSERALEEVADDFCAAVLHLSKGQDVLCSDFISA